VHLVRGRLTRTAPRNAFNFVTIPIARGGIHQRVDGCRIAREAGFNWAEFFNELSPIAAADVTQTGKGIFDRDLVSCQLLLVDTDEIGNRGVAFAETLVEPLQHQHDARLLALQPPMQLSNKTRCELICLGISAGQRCQFDHQRTGIFFSDSRDALRP